MAGILKRLETIERKLDACLVLLQMATTHDDFVYSRGNKSKRWLTAIAEAEKIAIGATSAVVDFHRDGMWAEDLNGLRVRRVPEEIPSNKMEEIVSSSGPASTQDHKTH